MQDAKRIDELLNRLADLRVDTGLTEADLVGDEGREPLRTAALRLAELVWATHSAVPHTPTATIHPRIMACRTAADTQAATQGGHLDTALVGLAGIPTTSTTTPSQQRLDALETLAGMVQASIIKAAKPTATTTLTSTPSTTSSSPQVTTAIAALALAEQQAQQQEKDGKQLQQPCQASTTLRTITNQLAITPPSSSSTSTSASSTLDLIQQSLLQVTQQLPEDFHLPACQLTSINPEQLTALKQLYTSMGKEYTLRRKMLLERARVTMGSFLWALNKDKQTSFDSNNGGLDDPSMALAQISAEPAVEFDRLFETTLGEILVDATAPAVRGGSRSNKRAGAGAAAGGGSTKQLLIGKVPDRGGRTGESRSKANMPTWSMRRVGAPKAGGAPKGGGGGKSKGGAPKPKGGAAPKVVNTSNKKPKSKK